MTSAGESAKSTPTPEKPDPKLGSHSSAGAVGLGLGSRPSDTEWFDPKQKTGAIRVANQWLKRTKESVQQVLESARTAVRETDAADLLPSLQNELATLWARLTMLHYVQGFQASSSVASGSASKGSGSSKERVSPREQAGALLREHIAVVSKQMLKVPDLKGLTGLSPEKILTGENVGKLLRDPPSKGYQSLLCLPQMEFEHVKLYDAASQTQLEELQAKQQDSKNAIADLLVMTRTHVRDSEMWAFVVSDNCESVHRERPWGP